MQPLLISAILPTFHREHLLAEAVSSVLTQDVGCAEVEIVVANDSGEPLGRADWQRDPRVLVVDTNRTERSVARNTGAALSRGEFLHFLDDDDILLPGAYKCLVHRAQDSDAVCTCGGYEAWDPENGTLSTVTALGEGRMFAPLVAGNGIPLGSCLVRREAFFASGGFDPGFVVMEDLELLQRIALLGGFARVNNVVARFRVGAHAISTTDGGKGGEACRRQRENAFGMASCRNDLQSSLREWKAPHCRGRLVRYYLGSSSRHVKRFAVLTGLQRAVAALGLSGPGLMQPGFWKGFVGPDEGRSALCR